MAMSSPLLHENPSGGVKTRPRGNIYGAPEGKMGDRPMAVIKLVPGAKVTEEHIYKFLENEGVSQI